MSGLMYPSYQKFYSALSCLQRFNKEANFFDNISAIDNFFSEYRNITFVMQASLKPAGFYDIYIANRDKHLIDRWFVEKRNETTKEKPFELIKEVLITIYSPEGGFALPKRRYFVENDEPLETIINRIENLLCEIDPYEVHFSVSFFFHEANSDVDLLKRCLQGISSMRAFLEATEQDVGEKCSLCDQVKQKIEEMHITDIPLDFLCVNDYTYFPKQKCFDRAERISMVLANGKQKIASHFPISSITETDLFNFDGTVFGNFTAMHAFIRTIKPGADIMPVIMVVYDDDTYDLDAFQADMKTTFYRKISEVSDLIEQENVSQVCFMSLYATTSLEQDHYETSRERVLNSTHDILVCASVDKQLREQEYVFDGKCMEKAEYVIHVMLSGRKNCLDFSAINLSPIKRAFERKKQS